MAFVFVVYQHTVPANAMIHIHFEYRKLAAWYFLQQRISF
jgi:hypothetical protein